MLSEQEIIERSIQKDSCAGVYFLIKDGSVIYVGSTLNLETRLNAQFHTSIKHDSYHFIRVPTTDRMSVQTIEAEYILRLKPKKNISIPTGYKWVRLSNMISAFDHKIKKAIRYTRVARRIEILEQEGIEVLLYGLSINFGPSPYVMNKDRKRIIEALNNGL